MVGVQGFTAICLVVGVVVVILWGGGLVVLRLFGVVVVLSCLVCDY